jgi:hypothetical protein
VDPVKITVVNVLDLGLGKSIYSKEQMEDFARFQDSQNTRRAYLAETAELAYMGRGGRMGARPHRRRKRSNSECGGVPADTALQTDRSNSGDHDPGDVHSVLDVLVRAIIIARVCGWGFWMFGALWDTAFQVAVSPFRWAVEKGKEGAGQIRNQMEARAAYAGGNLGNLQTTWRCWQTGQPHGDGECMEWRRPLRQELEEQTFP